MSQFWDTVNTQLNELRSAATADDVATILRHARNPYGPDHSSAGDGFFAGSGGDETVLEALRVAGWRVTWAESAIYYIAQAPDGSTITYIEGDIYRGERRLRRSA